MRLFSIKARDRNLGSGMARYKANAVYQRLLKATKASWRSPGTDEVSIILFSHKLNIVLEGWKDLRKRLEYYKPMQKKSFFLQSKGGQFLPSRYAKLLSIV